MEKKRFGHHHDLKKLFCVLLFQVQSQRLFYSPPVYRCSSQQLSGFLSAPWPRQSFPSLPSPASLLWRLSLGLRWRLNHLSWAFFGAELLRAAWRRLRKERGKWRVRGARAPCRRAPPDLQSRSLSWVGWRGGRGAGR